MIVTFIVSHYHSNYVVINYGLIKLVISWRDLKVVGDGSQRLGDSSIDLCAQHIGDGFLDNGLADVHAAPLVQGLLPTPQEQCEPVDTRSL